MKGLMATLVALGLTGMVSGQQPQNNSSAFNPSQSSQNNSTQAGSSSQSKWEPLAFDMDEQTIDELKRVGSLTAKIDLVDKNGIRAPLDTINGILFASKASVGTSAIEKNYGLIMPIGSIGDTTLVFEFDDEDLKELSLRDLRYRFSDLEIGKFQSVQIRYKGWGIHQTPSGSGTGSIADRHDPNQHATTQNQDDRYASAGREDGLRDYNRGIVGPPRLPTRSGLFAQRENFSPPATGSSPPLPAWSSLPNPGNVQSRLEPFDDRSRSSDRGGDSFAGRATLPNQQRFDDSSMDSRGGFSNGNSLPTLNSDRGQTATLDDDTKELELIAQEIEARRREAIKTNIILAGRETAELENANYQRQQNLLNSQRNRNDPVWDENERRTNQTAFLDRQFEDRTTESYSASGSPDYRDTSLINDRRNLVRNDAGQQPQPTGSIKDFGASIAGESENKSQTTMYPVLFSMLLASLGLNIYLAWLTRGFYVRYNELADELRETFTATM